MPPLKESPKQHFPEMQQTPDFCCPCGGFLGWKQIRLGGKSLSRSYGDLRSLGGMQAKGWAWQSPDSGRELVPPRPLAVVEQVQVQVQAQAQPPPGTSPLERMPPEVLGKKIHTPPPPPRPQKIKAVEFCITRWANSFVRSNHLLPRHRLAAQRLHAAQC